MWVSAMASAVVVVKRTHKMLTLDQKLDELDRIGKKSYIILSEEYGIGQSTISDIKKWESSLQQYKYKMKYMGGEAAGQGNEARER